MKKFVYPKKRDFYSDETGAVLVEFTVLFVVFFGLLFGIIEFSYVMWQWNLARFAAEEGARLAVVLDPGASLTCVEGEYFECKGDETCEVDGESISSNASIGEVSQLMQNIMPNLNGSEILIRYSYLNCVEPPIISVDVRVLDKKIQTPMISFFGISEISLPNAGYSLIGEDLETN